MWADFTVAKNSRKFNFSMCFNKNSAKFQLSQCYSKLRSYCLPSNRSIDQIVFHIIFP